MTACLAIDGGTPVRSRPLPPWPALDEEMVEALASVGRSGRINYWTGVHGRAFEREYAASLGRRFGIAVANGTLALELALRAFSVGPGHEVIVPARTFIATASAVVAVGATPIVADVDPASGTLTAATVESVLSARTRAVIPVHLGGWPVDMDRLLALARDHGLVVIEDAAQAHGGLYRDRPVGALGSDAAAFSFCNDKILSTGEGGMLVLDDPDAYARAWAYKDHGKSLERVEEASADDDVTSFKWLVESFGTNWRLGEFEAALGRIGLRRLPGWHEARTRNARVLVTGLADTPGLVIPVPPGDTQHAFYRLYAFVQPERLVRGWDRDRIARAVAAEGVVVQYGTCAEIYRERAFRSAGLGPRERLPGARVAHETSLAFLVHPTLRERDLDDVVAAVRKVMEVAAR